MSNHSQVKRLQVSHRKLDVQLKKLESAKVVDEPKVKELKRRKLQLKDRIAALKQAGRK